MIHLAPFVCYVSLSFGVLFLGVNLPCNFQYKGYLGYIIMLKCYMKCFFINDFYVCVSDTGIVFLGHWLI